MAPKNNDRFARIISEAFTALGVTQLQFRKMGGPSDTTLRKIMDGEDTGISVRTLSGLDRAFGWAPGSAARTLAGGSPTRLTDEADQFLNQMRHPRYASGLQGALDKQDTDMLSVLEELLRTGELPPNAQEQLERVRDDAVIDQFPKRFESLTRVRKLRVARYAFELWIEQQQEEKDTGHGVPTAEAQKSHASTEAVEGEEVSVADEVKDGASIDADVGSQADNSGVSRAEDGKKRHDLTGG